MYAIVDTGGKQYKVSPGAVFNVEKIEAEAGSEVVLDKVLLARDGQEEIKVGTPYLDQCRVVCEVLKQDKDKKIMIFKHKQRKDYRKRAGHRQEFTQLQVKEIEV
ncbi:MAG: 50S ribosomal protein L21 [Desulfohalobiaceae bacterium]